jgi:hypothetical protein
MLKIVLFVLLFVAVFSVGVFIGMWIYRAHMNRHTGEYLSEFIGNIIEQNGLVAFHSDDLSLHVLDKKAYSSLLKNMLDHYESESRM